MSDHRVKHKSRRHSSNGTRKRKKSRKRSSSSSNDCVIVNSTKDSSRKEKRHKSRKKKHRTAFSGESSCSDTSVARIKLGKKPKQLLGERPEFCKNSVTRHNVVDFKKALSHSSSKVIGTASLKRGHERSSIERRVLATMLNEIGKKRKSEDHLEGGKMAKKSKKSRKRRSVSASSSSSDDSSSDSSSTSLDSSNSSSDSSSSDSDERRKRKRKKKKLAKKMKREEKRRKEEKRKLKRLKEKSKTSVTATQIKEIKRIMTKAPQDRLLTDINVELADRARAMAPMTKEQWEKKQSIVRRVYDDETGRHRLIKGDGEVLEEIVSRDRHMAINRQATKGDGEFFQSRLRVKK